MIFNILYSNLLVLKAQLKEYYMLGKGPNSAGHEQKLPPSSYTEENQLILKMQSWGSSVSKIPKSSQVPIEGLQR